MAAIKIIDEANWHELRACNIGASEVAALFGMSRYTSKWQLWMEKSGKLPPENLDDNKAVQAGRHLESGIASWAAETWDMPITKVVDYHTDDTTPGMGASLDFACDGAPVEIKWSGWGHGFEIEGDEIVFAPDSYLIQIQHQIACYGGNHGWLIALVKNEPRRMLVPRNDDVIASIRAEVADFWASIEAGKAPDPDYVADAEAISRLALQEPITDVTLGAEHLSLFTSYISAMAAEKAAKEVKDATKAEITMLALEKAAGMNTSMDKAVIRCGDHKMSLSKVAENPGKIITADMVGQAVGARKAYVTARVS